MEIEENTQGLGDINSFIGAINDLEGNINNNSTVSSKNIEIFKDIVNSIFEIGDLNKDLIERVRNINKSFPLILGVNISQKIKISPTCVPSSFYLEGIEIKLTDIDGRGRKVKYIGTINGKSVVITSRMMRILQGIIDEHPNFFKPRGNDSEHRNELAKIFPEGTFHFKHGFGVKILSRQCIETSSIDESPKEVFTNEPDNSDIQRCNIMIDGIESELYLQKIEGHEKYAFVIGGKIVSKEIILSSDDLRSMIDILGEKSTIVSKHIKSKLEQYTPFSLKREEGIIRIFLKNNLQKFLDSVLEIQNGNDIESDSENDYLFEKEICGVKIISSSTQFEGKRKLYLGKIGDSEFEFTIGTMRVLKGVIKNFPNYYKSTVNDVRAGKKLICFSDGFKIEYVAKFGFKISI
ncbi:hypothetical protein GW846_02605 [Candidatus Gracilibacteria bacterium]|nr:hypothetical protein [Candidatus Gracilibacteria bacterium]